MEPTEDAAAAALLIAIVQGVAVPVAVALLAFAATVAANEAKRRTDRRIERELKLQSAVDALRALAVDIREGKQKLLTPYEVSWRFGWVISSKREEPMAAWWNAVVVDLFTSSRIVGDLEREHSVAIKMDTAMGALTAWRLGTRKMSWFRAEIGIMAALKRAET